MLRHCTMAELLDIRDGEGSTAARAHVDDCGACRTELDRLYQRVASLKALPSLRPPRERWSTVRERLVSQRRRRWNIGVAVAGVTAAAAVVAVVGVGGVPQLSLTNDVAPSAITPVELESLRGQSRQLEGLLREVEQHGRVIDGLTASAIADLEDRIALIDAGIEHATVGNAPRNDLASLWQQRLALMDALVNVHVRQVAYEGF